MAISIACVLCLAIGAAVLLRRETRTLGFGEITGNLASSAAGIRAEDGSPVGPEMLSDYYEARYKRFRGETGNTAHFTWFFLDENGRELFSLTDLGNRNLIRVTVGGKARIYQVEESN